MARKRHTLASAPKGIDDAASNEIVHKNNTVAVPGWQLSR
jgi:hypothetical protein